MRFFAPDAGGASGGAAASGAGGAGGAGGVADAPITTPFDDLPWDSLDEADRTKFEKAKTDFVATVQSKRELEKNLARTDLLARQFQSKADQLEAEKKAATKPTTPTDDPYITAVNDELLTAGYSADEAKKLAPVFAGMFKKVGVIQKDEIGRGLAPMAASVLANNAQAAFEQATQNDQLGMFGIPEVAQAVWDLVRERVTAGVETNADIVLNLAKMAWADHEAASRASGGGSAGGGGGSGGGAPPRPTNLPAVPPNMRTGGGSFSYPGAGLTPTATGPRDANAPRHALNDDTRQALAQTFKAMGADTGVFPKDLKPIIQTTRPRR